jgi:hypothetical protein
MSNTCEITIRPANPDHLQQLSALIDSDAVKPDGVATADSVEVETNSRSLPALMQEVENMAADAAMSLEIVISCDAEGPDYRRVITIENGKQLI